MNVVIAGNGIIALQTARRIVRERDDVRVTLVGPRSRGGSASLAAAAMFNSFCEVDAGTFETPFERLKFDFNRAAAPMWPEHLAELRAESGLPINAGFGTFLINNAVTDQLEDETYDAVRDALARVRGAVRGRRPDARSPATIPRRTRARSARRSSRAKAGSTPCSSSPRSTRSSRTNRACASSTRRSKRSRRRATRSSPSPPTAANACTATCSSSRRARRSRRSSSARVCRSRFSACSSAPAPASG